MRDTSIQIPTPGPALPRSLCTDCGLSRGAMAGACGQACQFIQPDYPTMEQRVHGRQRGDGASGGDEVFFGPFRAIYRARLARPREGAQWTGLTTRLAERLLETGAIDAVLTVVPDAEDRWKPRPAIITDPADMAMARGMRMGYAPLLALLEPAAQAGYRKIAVIGIPCQIYALRRIEAELKLDALYVIGTPCSDNTDTESFHSFLGRLDPAPETITYLEFRADYRVELRYEDGRRRIVPFLNLPISDLPDDFFPLTCRTCVDYTNVLADITVGYMGGTGEQWLIVRNDRGTEMLEGLGAEVVLEEPADSGDRTGPVRGFLSNTEAAAGGLPLRRMPKWLRPIVSFLMPRFGPKGMEFARARLEMKAVETVIHLRRHAPRKIKNMVPRHVWQLTEKYGLVPGDGETRPDGPDTSR